MIFTLISLAEFGIALSGLYFFSAGVASLGGGTELGKKKQM